MNERERFLRYMDFQPVDRIPLMEMGVWDETLDRWHHEGLPKWVTCLRHLEDYLHLCLLTCPIVPIVITWIGVVSC